MKPVYKKVKAIAEFCPKCGERLGGNNSIATPWECKCGIWEPSWNYADTDCECLGEYHIKQKCPQ